jgi:L-2-hydroxyglutarate oxidase LhgO
MDSVEAIVVGAGVVGLACARALARAGKETIILERNDSFGAEISARNSEVIHAGIYYPRNSLKAVLCIKGRQLLYKFCEQYHIEHKRCGKLIVATSENQINKLSQIKEHAIQNGVTDLRVLSPSEVRNLEPALKCVSALYSPSTGIINSHDYMRALLGDAEDCGASIALKSELLSAEYCGDHFIVNIGGVEETKLRSSLLINAGGLSATKIADNITGLSSNFIPKSYLAKGNYFSLSRKAPFSHLVYPVPEPGGLGVHLTLDLGGQARFGPDVEWVTEIDYEVDPSRAEKFYDAIRSYWPSLEDKALQPAYSGIRPKVVGPGEGDADFIIQDDSVHGLYGLVNLFGIESPGLTSSLAIAQSVLKSLGVQSSEV